MTIAEFDAGAARLVDLLPTLYGLADAAPTAEDGYLHTLLGLIAEQVEELEHDLAALYDDLFIETCAPWAVPYIGELVGVAPVRDIDGQTLTTRSQVANVIAFRRRKGTADVVEELAVAVTGWAARVVEMFRLVATTQHLDHQRPAAGTVSLRSARDLELIDTAFDPFTHTVEPRWIRSGRGRHNTQNLAVFLWPQTDLRLEQVDAAAVDATRHRFHPLGIDTVLLTNREGGSAVGAAATLAEVPWPIGRRLLLGSLSEGPALYGPSESLLVETAEGVAAAGSILVCSLGDDGLGGWEHAGAVPADRIAVDPERGRLVLGSDFTAPVTVTFGQALPGPIGGGYARDVDVDTGEAATQTVSADGGGDHATVDPAITAALAAAGADADLTGTVVINDNRTYVESPDVTLAAGITLELAAGDRRRPVLQATDGLRVTCGDGASLVLDGLLVAGGPVVVAGRPDRVTIRHCTLVPGHDLAPDLTPARPNAPSLLVECDVDVTPEITVERSILGPILASAAAHVTVADSIVTAGVTGNGDGEQPTHRLVAVSADLSPFPGLGPAPNVVQILVTGHPLVPVDLGSAGDPTAVANALAAVGPDPDVVARRVGDRVVVAAGDSLSIRNGGPDAVADALGFTGDGIRSAVLGVARTEPLAVGGPSGRLGLRRGSSPLVELDLGGAPGTLDDAATALQAAIRGARPEPEFSEAIVFALADRLAVVPGAADVRWSFAAVDADAVTADALGLDAPLASIAGDGYTSTGPDVRLERVTAFGAVRATAIDLVSDSIVRGPLIADRGQEGCVRFSFLGDGSVTPRRYRCLPDHRCTPQLAIAALCYGHPRLGELVPTESMIPVRHGSSEGDEMGAYCSFQRRLREQSLTFNLDEFMRFSMEAGLLDGRPTSGG